MDKDLGQETGSTKAVEAGQNTQGQPYYWTLMRGDPTPREEGAEGVEDSVFAMDASCRCCLFPMLSGKMEKIDSNYAVPCGACGTKYSLEKGERAGEVLEYLPGEG